MNYCLGKKPARHAAKFKFSDIFDASKLPTPPAVFGHYQAVKEWFGLGNNDFGNCVWAGAAHETMLWSVAGGRPRAHFTIYDVNSAYTAVTGFDPHRPATDQGTDMKDAADYRVKTGVVDTSGVRHKIDSYAALQPANYDEAVLAAWLTGALGIGLQLPAEALQQFDEKQTWSVPAQPHIAGGHYVPGVGRNAAGNMVFVSWGALGDMNQAFYERFNDETFCYLSLELLDAKGLSPEGFNRDALLASMKQLTA
jgi:hypothetical protein